MDDKDRCRPEEIWRDYEMFKLGWDDGRADERRRCANRAIAFLRSLGPDEEWNEESLTNVIMQGIEPTNKSEDVEKDIQTVFAHMLWTDRSREAWSRLVERIKE